MYCSNCGKKLSPDDYFCSNCGTPVLRQGLFDDTDANNHEDAFEETRLFTAEELGKYLNEDEESLDKDVIQQPVSADREAAQEMPKRAASSEKMADKGAEAKAAAAEMMGAASAFAGKFKGKFGDFKAKQAEKKHAREEARQAKASAEANARETAPQQMAQDDDDYLIEPVSVEQDTSVSAKKVILPVIVLGLIIGLVIGLVLIQPWQNSDNANADDTAVAAAMLEE